MTPSKKLIKFWISKLIAFFRSKDFKIDPIPQINLIDSSNDVDNLLISTGNYDYLRQEINLFIDNRHLKDIIRSFSHEMIHHHQYLDNPDYFRRVFKGGSIAENKDIRELESEAYLLGNLYFRDFTETFTHQ